MSKYILFFGVTMLLCGSCAYLKNVQLLTGGSLKRKDFVQEIPFHYRKGLIVLKARINDDTTSREFIFDTGAFNSKIEKGLADDLGLETVTTKENSTAQGNTQVIEVTRIDSIRFGKTSFYNIGAGKLEYSEKSYSPCVAKDGLIGSNLIKLAHWKIDYAHRKIYFSDKPFKLEKEDFTIIPFSRPVFSSTPKIELDIEKKKIDGLMFDTGYNGGLVLPSSLADAFQTSSTKVVIDRSTAGIYGSNTDTLAEKTLTLKIGHDEFNVPVGFSSLGKGLLGNDFLEHFTVLIDNDQNEVLLKRMEDVDVAPALLFIPAILNDSLWIVNRVSSDQRSIQLGDTLRSVNGKRPRELFADHCDYFHNIRTLLDTDSLTVETIANEIIHLK